jgi:hypothetical protein
LKKIKGEKKKKKGVAKGTKWGWLKATPLWPRAPFPLDGSGYDNSFFLFLPFFFSSFFNVFPFFFFTSAFWGLTRGYRSNFKNFVPKNDHFL